MLGVAASNRPRRTLLMGTANHQKHVCALFASANRLTERPQPRHNAIAVLMTARRTAWRWSIDCLGNKRRTSPYPSKARMAYPRQVISRHRRQISTYPRFAARVQPLHFADRESASEPARTPRQPGSVAGDAARIAGFCRPLRNAKNSPCQRSGSDSGGPSGRPRSRKCSDESWRALLTAAQNNPAIVREHQDRARLAMVTAAARHSRYYRAMFEGEFGAGFEPEHLLDDAYWTRIPVFTSASVVAHARDMCTRPPEELDTGSTGGSSGKPVLSRSKPQSDRIRVRSRGLVAGRISRRRSALRVSGR